LTKKIFLFSCDIISVFQNKKIANFWRTLAHWNWKKSVKERDSHATMFCFLILFPESSVQVKTKFNQNICKTWKWIIFVCILEVWNFAEQNYVFFVLFNCSFKMEIWSVFYNLKSGNGRMENFKSKNIESNFFRLSFPRHGMLNRKIHYLNFMSIVLQFPTRKFNV
jgi:hypothetical protein